MLVPSSRHPSLLRSEDALLLVIDMQKPLLDVVWEPERLLVGVGLLMDAARILRVPVVPTVQNSRRLGPPVEAVTKRLPSLAVPFDKMQFSCLGSDAIGSEVHRSGRRQILLCGMETHVCVSQTAHDLLAHGYEVHVAADAVSSRTERNWEIGLRRMERAGAVITSAETAIYEMLYEAGTPEFREVLELVK